MKEENMSQNLKKNLIGVFVYLLLPLCITSIFRQRYYFGRNYLRPIDDLARNSVKVLDVPRAR